MTARLFLVSQPPSATRPTGAFSVWPAAAYVGAVLLFLGLCAWRAWPLPEEAFLSDGTAAAWLSSAQLWTMAVLSLRLARERALPPVLAGWLALAFTGMAFDEQFMLHEQWKYGCADWLAACHFNAVRELPMYAVGCGGVATAAWLAGALPSGAARMLLWAAIAVGVFALLADLAAWPAFARGYEEAFECIAEALFAGLLLGIQNTTHRSHS